jgi:hypothetical protein
MREAPPPSQTAPDPWYVLYFKLDLEQHLSKCSRRGVCSVAESLGLCLVRGIG